MGNSISLVGQRFGKLTVLKENGRNKNHRRLWLCKCDCGKTTSVHTTNLLRNTTKSCGCLVKETMSKIKTKHHQTHTRLYNIYIGIKSRCYYSKDIRHYKDYGGRGIKMCDEWKNDFMSFYNWAMSNGYKDGLTIDRIDVNGNYEPSNCRWATRIIQANNRRDTVFITYKNETHTIREWSEILGIDIKTIRDRYRRIKNNLEKVFYRGKLNNNGEIYGSKRK